MAPVPAIAHNPRLRSILLAWTFLVVALYTLSKGSEHTSGSDGVGEAAMRMLKQPVWHGGQDAQRARALRWKQDRPVNVEKWEEESLNRWRDSPDMVSDPYDTETNHRPHNGSYTAAVIYLTRISRIRETLASLESLARYMPMEQAYSFILVHSGDLAGLAAQQEVLSRWNERIEELHQAGEVTLGSKMKVMAEGMEFLKIDMDAPVEVQRKGMEAWDDVVFGGDTWPGYHSMCRFFAVDIFWNHQIRQFDYYMRMDTDSYILTPMHSDPFRRIRASGASYAYRQPGGDPEYVVKGLPDYIEAYMDAHEHDPGAAGMRQRVDNSRLIESARHEREGGMAAYYNNWEIAHVPSFRRPGVRDWLVGLAGNDEGFYRYRWGDAPLRYATIQMFFEEHEYERYCDFAYYHQFMLREGELVMTDPGPTWKCPEH